MANEKFTVVGTNIQEKATVIWNIANSLAGYFKPHEYGLVILPMTIVIVFAEKWHSDFPALKTGYVDDIIAEGPADACKPLLKLLGLTDNEKENGFYSTIFERWMAMHEPYWKLSDPREYTFKAMVAAYQLGISMILEKYGY